MVETALVLAISAAALVAFMATISVRIGRERYNDSTNSFVDFLRRIYSETINVQNPRSGSIDSQNDYCTLAGQYAAAKAEQGKNPDSDGYPGRSGCAIYGKLITFGENVGTSNDDKRLLYVYDVIGRAIDLSHPLTTSGDIADQLAAVNADVLTFAKNETTGLCSVLPVGDVEKYTPSYNSQIETDEFNNLFKGALLIVRSPASGAVHTYVLEDEELELQRIIAENHSDLSCNNVESVHNSVANMHSDINGFLKDGKFELKEVDFCVGSSEIFASVNRRNNIRVAIDGHNSTAVEFVETDLSADEGGNRCK